ncbi:MAG: transposase [Proteobacteria bacterium]|nr:transposase [Pseudomonadota bacterium]
MQYRRARMAGGSYFFTVNLLDRRQTWLVDYVDVLRERVRIVKRHHPFHIDAMVIMPDHVHAIWTLPEGDADFSTRWGLIKAGFSKALPAQENVTRSRAGKGERGIWQRRFWEHVIRDDDDYARHVDNIHFNPVKHGYVTRPVDWAYSSIHRWIEQGWMPADWAAAVEMESDFGERAG